jgi:hypothetical protein
MELAIEFETDGCGLQNSSEDPKLPAMNNSDVALF